MNELQSVVFDLLKEFVCAAKVLNVKWYLVHGSALGAVKYGGFIPWDDDIDIAIPRDDYEKFCKEAQALLPEYIFLQNYRTDKNFPHTYSKLRNSKTTFIENGVSHLEMNHGIFIDIFPLDEYPSDEAEQEKLLKKLKLLRWKQYCSLNDTSKSKVVIRNKIFRLLGYHKKTARTVAQIESIVTQFDKSGECWCNHGDRMGKKGCIKKAVYGSGTSFDFEGLSVNIPEKYDEYLTLKYGDWRKDLPKAEQASHHTNLIVDTKTSYLKYMSTSNV